MAKSKAPTDFNDLKNEAGLSVVANAVSAPVESLPTARSEPLGYGREMPEQGEADWELQLRRTKNGTLEASIHNTHLILTYDQAWRGVLGYCAFSYRIIKRAAPPWGGELGEWSDTDTARLRIWLSAKYAYTPRSADADDAVKVVAKDHAFHPVRDYLEGLTWDKKPRLRQWLKLYLGVDSQAETKEERDRYERYQSLVGVMWALAAVARVMEPGAKSDCVIIFEGAQGLGKSTALKILGGEWFSDTHFALGEKDGYQQMQGLWIVELAELDSFNKAESTRAKQFFGSSEDRYRPAYGRHVESFKRQCVFAGTTNQDNYLKDPTGNRRYWPVFCTKLDAEALSRDRDQIWAEAVHLYRLGEDKWWVQDCDRHLFEEQQDNRFSSDAWEDLIVEYLSDPSNRSELITTSDIMSGALSMEPSQMRPPEQTRVGLIMSRLGWQRVRRTIKKPNGKSARVWGYEPVSG